MNFLNYTVQNEFIEYFDTDDDESNFFLDDKFKSFSQFYVPAVETQIKAHFIKYAIQKEVNVINEGNISIKASQVNDEKKVKAFLNKMKTSKRNAAMVLRKKVQIIN